MAALSAPINLRPSSPLIALDFIVLLEACVTSARSARAAEEAGAGRIELCARIALDGLTPALRTMRAARSATRLPIHALVRPHDRGYVYGPPARRALFHGIARARAAGLDGVVLGCLTARGEVDQALLAELVAAARPLAVTFHRAFDRVARPGPALEALIRMHVDHVLTSGGAPTAARGARVIGRLVRQAAGRIGVIAAGRVRAANVRALVAATGVRTVHAHSDAVGIRALAAALGQP
jgi:copper homeostasis protein